MLRTALVTGANSGIGLETAIHVARLGFAVVGTARSDEKAASLHRAAADAGVQVETAVLDVTDAPRCEQVVRAVEPWAVVNNAGYMNVGQVVDVPPEEA
ncbi:MAG: SDR family NAD(P)-dependent oxidoreductase, partial [Actinomycetota bacterium]|nr:SDR family NAD(P)-dependent oxidoreductase [Actinomycetota bacterium]